MRVASAWLAVVAVIIAAGVASPAAAQPAIFAVVLALNLAGDALRDLLDPRTHAR